MSKRALNITLDDYTWKLAKKKSNFSAWIRAQLRSEQLQKEAIYSEMVEYECPKCNMVSLWAEDEKYPYCRNTRSCPGGNLTKVTGIVPAESRKPDKLNKMTKGDSPE